MQNSTIGTLVPRDSAREGDSHRPSPEPRSWLARLAAGLVRADMSHRNRLHASRLSDHMLRDVGLTRDQIWREDLPFFMQQDFR